jgi:hypothetical protein
MTRGAVILLSACASTSSTATTTPPRVASTTVSASVTAAHAYTGPLSPESRLALRACVDALVDDPSSPGAAFVEKVRKLSVGYPMVEPLTAAQESCDDARDQLEADPGVVSTVPATVFTDVENIINALDLAAEQIRTDAFYLRSSVPAQFIPDGATALQRSIADFYSRVLPVLD